MRRLFVSWQWLLSFGLATWFLFIHSPPVLRERGALHRPDFLLHLAGAYVVYVACLHNTLYNPFMSKTRHAVVGQVGLLCGAAGFLFGLVTIATSWSEIDRGFAVGITVGGILQMQLQYRGYRAIQQYKQVKDELQRLGEKTGPDPRAHDGKNGTTGSAAAAPSTTSSEKEEHQRQLLQLREKKNSLLRTHVGCMVGLLVNACGMPAAMRLVAQVGLGSGVAPILLALGLLHYLKMSHLRSVCAQLPPDGKKDE